VTGDAFLVMVENNALRHLPVGTVFQLNGALPHFSRRVGDFLDGEFLDRWTGRGEAIPCPLPFSRSDSSRYFLSFYETLTLHCCNTMLKDLTIIFAKQNP
jgi:hypothetical protein